jgi:hypothetical protein
MKGTTSPCKHKWMRTKTRFMLCRSRWRRIVCKSESPVTLLLSCGFVSRFVEDHNLSHKYPAPKVFTIAQIAVHQEKYPTRCPNVVPSGALIDTHQRQIALSLLECLREDLMYARLNNGNRILDVADLRQYIYEQMGRIPVNALTGIMGACSKCQHSDPRTYRVPR